MKFTPTQLRQFARYVKVQKGGRYNMFDPRAANAACLTRDEMVFIMKNYDALKAEAAKAKEAA